MLDRQVRRIEESGDVVATCPKRMVYGPCGGVRTDGRCEVDDRRCPFVDMPLVRWAGPAPAGGSPPLVTGEALIVTDLRVRPYDRRSIEDVTARLAAHSDALLIGEHHVRPDYPPATMAAYVAAAGGRPWVTLSCRDRNRVVLEAELEGLVAVGALGVHCVTGDARAPSVRTDATQVFDLDALRLTALARRAGLAVSVAATPVAPPVELRAQRVVEKERAGGQWCFVNHAGGPEPVARFVAAARAAGATLGFLPCVSVFTDIESLEVLERFPGLVIDPDVRATFLAATDRRAVGIAAAVEQAQRMLAIDGVIGVNLSGSATSGPEDESAAIMAEVAGELRRSSSPGSRHP